MEPVIDALESADPRALFKNRIVDYQLVNPMSLIPNKKNWRRHPDAQRAALTGALTELGWVGVVTVNKTTGNLVDGHLRRDVAITRKESAIPAIFVELSEAEEAIMLASLDSIGALAVTDREALDSLLGEIEADDENLREFLDSLKVQDVAGLLDPTEGKDDSGQSESIQKMKFGEYEIPLTDIEVVALGRVADAYLEKSGSYYSFAGWLVKNVPA